MSPGARRRLDVSGRACPMPLVVLQRELRQMASGDEVEVVTDDRAFHTDLEAWCAHHGHSVTERSGKDGVYRAVVAKRSS